MKVWVPDGFDRGAIPEDVEIGPWFGEPDGVEFVGRNGGW